MENNADTIIFYYSPHSNNPNPITPNIIYDLALKSNQVVIFKDVMNKQNFVPQFINNIPALLTFNKLTGKGNVYYTRQEFEKIFAKPEEKKLQAITDLDNINTALSIPTSFTTIQEQAGKVSKGLTEQAIEEFTNQRNAELPMPSTVQYGPMSS